MIPVVWLAMFKKFGPWIAVVLVLVGLYTLGRSQGASKWKAKHNVARQEISSLKADVRDCSAEVIVLRGAIDAQNESVRIMGEQHDERVRTAKTVADRVLASQASVYQRKLREAASETRGLRDTMRTIGVAESCHEAWLEVLR